MVAVSLGNQTKTRVCLCVVQRALSISRHTPARVTWRMLFTTIHYYLPICLPTFTSLFTLAYQPVHPCPL